MYAVLGIGVSSAGRPSPHVLSPCLCGVVRAASLQCTTVPLLTVSKSAQDCQQIRRTESLVSYEGKASPYHHECELAPQTWPSSSPGAGGSCRGIWGSFCTPCLLGE